MSDDHAFTVVFPVYTEQQKLEARELSVHLPRVKFRSVFLGARAPAPVSWQRRLLDMLLSSSRRIRSALNFSPPRAPEPPVAPLPAPYNPFYPVSEDFIAALAEEIHNGVDLCQAEFAEMMQLGAWFPSTLPRLFIHHQIHTVYAERFADTCEHRPYLDYLVAIMRAQEQEYLKHFDGVVTFSEHDRSALHALVGAIPTFASPFPIPPDVGFAVSPASTWNGKFVFIGSSDFPPNQDALKWLLEDIWPKLVRCVPSAGLLVIGKWDGMQSSKLSYPRVEFTGFVANLADAIHGSIMLVPLRIGSGIRTKIMVAMAQGVPVVTTTVGGEGLALGCGGGGVVVDETTAFVEAAAQLAQDPIQWRTYAAAGLAMATREFSSDQVRKRRNEIYAAVVSAHRTRNSSPTLSIVP